MEIQNLVFWTCIDGMRRNGEFLLPSYLQSISGGAILAPLFATCFFACHERPTHHYRWLVGSVLGGAALGWLGSYLRQRRISSIDLEVTDLIRDLKQTNLTAAEVRNRIATEPQPIWEARNRYLAAQSPELDRKLIEELRGHPWASQEIERILGKQAPAGLYSTRLESWLFS